MKVHLQVKSEQLTKEDLRLLLQAIRDCEQKNFKDKEIFVAAEAPDLTADEMSEIVTSIKPPYTYGPVIFKYVEEGKDYMSEKKLNIDIELCGYRGKITRISGLEASPPLRPDAELYAWIEFDKPYPEGTTLKPITIPAKEYSRLELLAAVKKEGEIQFSESLARCHEENEKQRQRAEAKKRVEDLAERMEGLLEEKP